MTAATMKIERSGPVIRAALAEFAPDECAQFEAEFQQAIGQVSEKFDLAPLDAVLDRWWGIAAIRIEQDKMTLEGLMERLGIQRSPIKQAAGWIVEKVSRLKLSETMTGDR